MIAHSIPEVTSVHRVNSDYADQRRSGSDAHGDRSDHVACRFRRVSTDSWGSGADTRCHETRPRGATRRRDTPQLTAAVLCEPLDHSPPAGNSRDIHGCPIGTGSVAIARDGDVRSSWPWRHSSQRFPAVRKDRSRRTLPRNGTATRIGTPPEEGPPERQVHQPAMGWITQNRTRRREREGLAPIACRRRQVRGGEKR